MPRPCLEMLTATPAALLQSSTRNAGICLLLAATVLSWPLETNAQGKAQVANSQARVSEEGTLWRELTQAQRAALKPLERDWAGIDANQKQKWLEIAARFPRLDPNERSRIQARMTDWVRMTPEQRGQARANYQQARQVAPQDRQAQWKAYQSLSPEARRQLASKAPPPPSRGSPERSGKDDTNSPGQIAGRPAQQTKSNIVPNPAFASPARPVAPIVMQASPGATTTLISKRPAPPPHQQTGLPKITASPNFVDKSTLLPQRGPQGAAARTSAPSSAEASQRR